MATAKFTKDTVERLIKRKADALTFDESSPGFFLRSYKSGAPAVWCVKYSAGGAPRRMVLGKASYGNMASMRELAEVTRAKAKLGTDTLAEQRSERAKPRSKTLGELVEPYLKARENDKNKPMRKRSLYISRLYLEKHWKPLQKRPVGEITRKEIVALVHEMEETRGAVTADRAKTVLSTFYRWAMDKYVESNPCADIGNKASSGGRERVLSETELVAIWKAADDGSAFGKAVRLLMLTGARKMEVVGLMWPEVNTTQRLLELPAERVKIGKPFLIALSDPALEILSTVPAIVEQDRLFASFSASRYMDDFRAKLPADMEHWTLHDLRRSFSTHANEQGMAPPHIIDCAMGHIVGNKVSRTYNRALYIAERRQLMDIWAQHIADLVAGRKRKVLPFAKQA
jgi:integrase